MTQDELALELLEVLGRLASIVLRLGLDQDDERLIDAAGRTVQVNDREPQP